MGLREEKPKFYRALVSLFKHFDNNCLIILLHNNNGYPFTMIMKSWRVRWKRICGGIKSEISQHFFIEMHYIASKSDQFFL